MPVQLLPPDVIAKIAAGEVVDRPASVIKELLENSIDAGATVIDIQLKDAGKELLVIKDNGCGISREDLPKLFQRHATSKITSIDDLETLHSMGFRGEALYSIGAVSDVVIKTKIGDVPNLSEKLGTSLISGWQMQVHGGEQTDITPAAIANPGTEIQVSQIFFNTPARRKFLKNSTAEMNQILNIVIPYTLIYPQLKITVTHNGRSMVDARPAISRLERMAAVLNLKSADLLNTAQDYPQEKIYVGMVLGNINIQRPRRDTQFIMVNNRPVDSKSLSFAVNDIYKMILPPGVYGAFVLDVRIDPSFIDVNIHPTKREVRIKDESKIISIVRRLTEYTLMRFGQPRRIDAATSFLPDRQAGPQSSSGNPASDENISGSPTNTFGGDNAAMSCGISPQDMIWGPQSSTAAPQHDAWQQPNLFATDKTLNSRLNNARYVGHFMNKYQLFEDGNSLLLIDQHAAQERIMFEQLKDQMERGAVEVQPLLTPVLIGLNPQEKLAWSDLQPQLASMGIETNLFDQDTLAVQTQPVVLKNIERTLRTLLAGQISNRSDHLALARRACKASVVSGDFLSPEQANHQRRQLLSCRDPFTCPHGRPTVIELTDSFLERQFLRT